VVRDDRGTKRPVGRFAAADDLQDSGYSALVLERLVKHVCRVADVQRACIYVRDRGDPRALIAAAAHGTPIELVGTRVGADEGVLGRVLATGEPLLVPDCQALGDPVAPGFAEEATRAAFAPIRFEGAVRGVVAVAVCDENARLDAGQMELLCEMSDMAAAALDHASSHEDVRYEVAGHVNALAAAMDLRDRRTAEHSEDVVGLARMVGELLQLDQAALVELEFAARLHDVGKIRVPDDVLNKPGPLDPEEREVMRCHPAWGAETLSGVPGLEVVATIVRFHHERWDGRGYPDGLAGSCIPLASRIISVCDAFGAMTADRPYRAGIPVVDALAELRAGSGTQFDPAVVDAFCEAVTTHTPAAHG
jgi:HD-GYP domain-containing protein (c-di-GMP phosphodiesterase class II)